MRSSVAGYLTLMLGGLTLAASLAFNAAMMTTFDAMYPEPEDKKRKAMHKWTYTILVSVVCVLVYSLVAKYTDVHSTDLMSQMKSSTKT